MKKSLLLSSLLFFVVMLCSCEKDLNPPEAIFSMDKTTAKVGETVTFTNLSKNAGAFIWHFGDGTIDGVNRNTSYAYSSAGTYIVELLVMKPVGNNSKKGMDSATKTITITP
jgi:PKD repeat protein